MENRIINRDASDKIKGFVLQKWRATELLIDTLLEGKYTHVYCAIEKFDDVYQRILTDDGLKENFEQDKNYKSSFSFSSDEVKKSLVNFFDIWCRNELSESIRFAFYTTSNYTKEKNTEVIERLGIMLPDRPIIELLRDRRYEYNDVLEKVITIFKDYYIRTYESSKKTGNVKMLEYITLEQWRTFFDNIDWKFGEPDEQELKARIIEKIKKVKLYKGYVYGSEEYIFARINEMFDERLSETDFLKKLVHIAEIENIFMSLMVGENKFTDSAYKVWEVIPPPTDKRNLKDKLLSVCREYSRKKIAMHIMDFTSGQIEMNENPRQQCVSAYKYRVYEACKRGLVEFIDSYKNKGNIELCEEEIEEIFNMLFLKAKKHLEDKSKNYDYPFKDDDILMKTIYMLFENCFLCFDVLE